MERECSLLVRKGEEGLISTQIQLAQDLSLIHILCGRSMEGVRRNLTGEVLPLLRGMGFQCREQLTRGEVTVSLGRRRNIFCLFGGGDEGAAARIQGVTLAGALLDEAVLMPRSFVEQLSLIHI